MRAAFFASFAFLAACASGAPSEYQRGAFTPPPPAAARVGVGAPVVGQPGMQPRSIPVAPHRRVLPPTREPGFWAAADDDPGVPPLRKRGDPIPRIVILDVDVPTLTDAEDALDTMQDELCAYVTTGDLYAGDMSLARRAMALSRDARICLAARAHHACLDWMVQAYIHDSGNKFRNHHVAKLQKARDAAFEWVRNACPIDVLSPEMDAILAGMGRQGRSSPWKQ